MATHVSPDPHGLNPRQRKFVELHTSGMAAGRAYESAGYKGAGEAADTNASALRKNPKVAAALADAHRHLIDKSGFTKERMVEINVRILLSKPDEAAMDNPLCEIKLTKDGPVPVFPDKSVCMDRLNKMLGFLAADRNETGAGDELEALIRETRAGGDA